jgi:hypothetical protein
MTKPLSQVDEAFAWDEGQGDGTGDWRFDAHRRYFKGDCFPLFIAIARGEIPDMRRPLIKRQRFGR